MSIDLDAIEAHWLGDIDATDPYQALLDMRADLAALLAELRATTADLAVAVEVARERGDDVERLRDEVATAQFARELVSDEAATVELEMRTLRAVAEAAEQVAGAYANPWASEDDRLTTVDALTPALDAWRAGGGA